MSTTFEEIEDFSFGDLKGSSEQVLGEAFIMNTGAALVEPDLFTEGTYPIHTAPGQYIIMLHKFKNGNVKFEARVYKSAEELFNKELEHDRHVNELSPAHERCKYNCPPWILALLMFEHHTAPGQPDFERKLYENFPNCWLDEARAPKRRLILDGKHLHGTKK